MHAAAVLEALDDLVFDAAEHGEPLHRGGEIGRHCRARQQAACSAGNSYVCVGWIVIHDPAGDHRAEPLADIAFVEPGLLGNLVGRRGRQLGHHIEQAACDGRC